MKRITAMFLALLMLLALSACGASPDYTHTLPGDEDGSGVQIPDSAMVKASGDAAADTRNVLVVPPTEDVVTILDNGGIQLSTDGVDLSFNSFPFGWVVYTQDILAQIDLYLGLMDPAAVVLAMQDADLNLYSQIDDYSIFYLTVYPENFSVTLGSTNALDNATMDAVTESLQRQYAGYGAVSWEKIGDNNFFVYMIEGGGSNKVVLESISNSVCVDLSIETTGDMDEALDTLRSVAANLDIG